MRGSSPARVYARAVSIISGRCGVNFLSTASLNMASRQRLPTQ